MLISPSPLFDTKIWPVVVCTLLPAVFIAILSLVVIKPNSAISASDVLLYMNSLLAVQNLTNSMRFNSLIYRTIQPTHYERCTSLDWFSSCGTKFDRFHEIQFTNLKPNSANSLRAMDFFRWILFLWYRIWPTPWDSVH